MMRRTTAWTLAVSLLLCALAGMNSAAATTPVLHENQRLAVIVGAPSPITEISRQMLRRVFAGEPSDIKGVRLVPLNFDPKDPLRTAFDQIVLGFTQQTAGQYWIDRRIRGQGMPPRAVSNVALLRAVVARLPGAIGYLSADKLDPSVRALRIDGEDYTSANYALTLAP